MASIGEVLADFDHREMQGLSPAEVSDGYFEPIGFYADSARSELLGGAC